MRIVYCWEDVCMGCGVCEVACAVEHSQSKDIIKAFFFEEKEPQPRGWVWREKGSPVTLSFRCRHCEDPMCVRACIAGAMKREASGRVYVDEELCIGCWSCVMVCPFGAVRPGEGLGFALKCDLCPGREVPACVDACPNYALYYLEKEEEDVLP